MRGGKAEKMMVLKCSDANNLFSAAGTKYAEKPKQSGVSIKDVAKNPVSVVISKEGWEKYRSSMVSNKIGEPDQTTWLKDNFADRGFAFRISDDLKNAFLRIDDEKKPKGDRWGSAEDAAASMLEAYAELYDEIIRGYEDGTRVTYEADESCPEGRRILTKEEELAALDSAFEKMVTAYEMVRNRSIQFMKGIAESNRLFAEESARRRGRNEKYYELLDRAEKRERLAEKSKIPKNFGLMILKGMVILKKKYPEIKNKEDAMYDILKEVKFNKE